MGTGERHLADDIRLVPTLRSCLESGPPVLDRLGVPLDNDSVRTLKTLSLVALASVGVAAGPRLWSGVENYPADGVGGIIGALVWTEDTAYASGYTLDGWKRVRVGMSRSQVEAILGPPHATFAEDQPEMSAGWSYSPGDTHFRCRVLRFRNGVVVSKHSEFYVD